MKLVYFENRDGRTIAIAADKIISLTEKRLPTDTPVLVTCIGGVEFDVRGDLDSTQRKLMAAQEPKV